MSWKLCTENFLANIWFWVSYSRKKRDDIFDPSPHKCNVYCIQHAVIVCTSPFTSTNGDAQIFFSRTVRNHELSIWRAFKSQKDAILSEATCDWLIRRIKNESLDLLPYYCYGSAKLSKWCFFTFFYSWHAVHTDQSRGRKTNSINLSDRCSAATGGELPQRQGVLLLLAASMFTPVMIHNINHMINGAKKWLVIYLIWVRYSLAAGSPLNTKSLSSYIKSPKLWLIYVCKLSARVLSNKIDYYVICQLHIWKNITYV